MDWHHLKWDEGHIEIPARIAKTKIMRMIPLSDNLRAWLAPLRQKTGVVVNFNNLNTQYRKVAKLAGVKLKNNALRHSFISYRTALTKNVPQVALEAGNSVHIIEKNYLKVVTVTQGKEWFAITPASPENVIALPTTGAPKTASEAAPNVATVT